MRTHLLTAALAAITFSSASYATVLTFDATTYSNGMLFPQTYGDRVTGPSMTYSGDSNTYNYGTAGGITPNVTVAYRNIDNTADISLSGRSTGFGNMTQAAYINSFSALGYTILFTADTGYQVTLTSFDMATFGALSTVATIRIYDAGDQLVYSATNLAPPLGSSHLSVTPVVTSTTLRLQVDLSGDPGVPQTVGIDNIQFSQSPPGVAPEPATLGMLASSLLLLSKRRK